MFKTPGMRAPGMKAPGMEAPGMKAPGMQSPWTKSSFSEADRFHQCDLPSMGAGKSRREQILIKLVLLAELAFWLGCMRGIVYLLTHSPSP